MSDMQSAKAFSKSNSSHDTGVFSKQSAAPAREPSRTPRPASGFSPFTPDAKRASWEELARERESDGETKNYSVPPELIELARANRKARGQVGTLTPLAPKPPQEVMVVVPAASPLALDLRTGESGSVQQAPSVPIPADATSADPESARTVVAAAGYAASAEAASADAADAEAASADADETELASDEFAEGEGVDAEHSDRVPTHTFTRRTKRRARRSSRVELPSELGAAARAVSIDPPRAKRYVPMAIGAVIVGAYVVLCYYANALLAGMP